MSKGCRAEPSLPGKRADSRVTQAHIQQAKERMKSDGQLTGAEHQRLNTMQNKAGGDIYRQKHDARKVPVN